MLRPVSLTAGVALVALAACQPSNKPQPLTAADSTAIDQVRTAYITAFNAGNVDALVRLYTGDAQLLPPDAPAVKGGTALQAYFNKVLGTPARPTLDLPAGTLVGRQDLAAYVGAYTMTPPAAAPAAPAGRRAAPAPAAPAPIAGNYIVVCLKQADGSWKIAYHADTYNAPVTPPAAPAK